MAPQAEAAGVRLLLEALPARTTNTVNTLAEARAVITAIRRPGISSLLDFHNTTEESEPWDVLVRRHRDLIAHVHLNEVDGYHPSLVGRPGRARSDYLPAFRALAEGGYAGWISLEIFHVDQAPETILAETRAFLGQLERAIAP